MKNILQDIIIAVLVIIMCFVITLVTKASFVWIILPVFFTILLAILGKLLREKYGSSYGITIYLFLFFVVPLLWYLFCSQMPITALTLQTQKKAEDFSSFQNYEGSVDAKQQFVDFQLKQDSILKIQVSKLLLENKVDSALTLIKQSKENSERIKASLFSEDPSKQKTIDEQLDPNTTYIGNVPNNSTIYFTSNKPFLLLERTSLEYDANNVIEIPMPKGKSSKHWKWGGNILVRKTDAIIKYTYKRDE